MAKKRTVLAREEREEQLVETATSVFARKGYRPTSVADIIEATGVSRGTFYHYFGSKEDIFERVIDDYFERFEQIVEENHKLVTDGIEGRRDLIEAWRLSTVAVLRFHREHPDLTIVIYREATGLGTRFTRRIEKLGRLSKNRLAEQFAMLVERGLIIDYDMELLTTMVNGAILGLIIEDILGETPSDIEALAGEFVRYVTRALSPLAEGGARHGR